MSTVVLSFPKTEQRAEFTSKSEAILVASSRKVVQESLTTYATDHLQSGNQKRL
jgi:hypothetical protein